ncbi:chemotaxis response regulator protein-glutamate methylesterase [Sporomusa aerivorans]|uniref:protein-glutamate methylesterase/protein-glutamine glutaminase n=1 Tax=Sporomusa aerivorans TaxID=204936 RepID=UPI003529E798
MKKIKVMVVDDSLFYRELLARGIASDARIEVVATAANPFEARDKIIEYRPDVMTCDVEMPKMNGIEFIRKLIPQYPLPVIVISAVNHTVFDALEAGAVDFVAKPEAATAQGLDTFITDLIYKIKIASVARIMRRQPTFVEKPGSTPAMSNARIIAIGASTGGTEAVLNVIKSLPNSVPGIVVVQHIPPLFSRLFAERLNRETVFVVKEIQGEAWLEAGQVLVAPGNQHIKVKQQGDRLKVVSYLGEKVNGHCPSVDVLFESVAEQACPRAVGVLLTGMGADGAKGLLAMRRAGARTIGQDEASSVVYGMPKVAYNLGAVEKQAALENIPHLISTFLN